MGIYRITLKRQMLYIWIIYQSFKIECEKEREGWYLAPPSSDAGGDDVRLHRCRSPG